MTLLCRSGTDRSKDLQWEERLTELARSVTAWTGNDGRIVEYTTDELIAAAIAGEPLLDDISKQGLTVAGTRSWLNRQLKGRC